MIDYIKILKIVLTEINNTIKLHTNKLNNDKFEPNKDPELRKLLCIGKNKTSETVLTKTEFVSRLTKIRTELMQNKK